MTPPVSQGYRCWGVDEHVWHHQDRRRRGPRELTCIVDLTRGAEYPTARLSGPGPRNVSHRVQELAGRAWRRLPCRGANRDAGSLPVKARTPLMTSSKMPPACSMPVASSSSPGTSLMRYVVASNKTRPDTADAQALPSTKSGFFCAPHATSSPHVNKNDSAQPSRQMRRISVSKSPTTAPSKCARSSTKTHPPTADAWPLVSLIAYRRVPSPKSPDQAGPYATGRTPSWPTSTQPEPATAPRKPSTQIIELGRRTARGYHNPTNYQLRMLLIAGGLDTSTHPQL